MTYEIALLPVKTDRIPSFTRAFGEAEDHTRGFEPSRDHEVFMAGLREYLADEPTVHHVQAAVPLKGTDVFGP